MTLTALPAFPSTAREAPCPLITGLRAEGTTRVLVLGGEADVSTMAALSNALSEVAAVGAADVVVDLAETQFIDCGTVRPLAVFQRLVVAKAGSRPSDRRRGWPSWRSPSSASPV